MSKSEHVNHFESSPGYPGKEYFREHYKGKHVLITGDTGFKGSWLSIWLHSIGAKVIGYSNPPPTEPSNFQASRLDERITHIDGDIRDDKHLNQVLKDNEPEFIFHLAAQAIVRFSYEKPKLTYDTNITGLINLLEAIRKTKSVRVVINVTSDKCYENKEWIWGYRESDPMGGYDPYSSSKACSELITTAYRNSYFNPKLYDQHQVALATVRAGNIIGGGDWAVDRIVPDCVRAIAADRSIEVRNPSATRPWQHVFDPLGGYMLLGVNMREKGPEYSSAWNFGPVGSQIVSVKQLVEGFIQEWGKGNYFTSSQLKPRPHEANYLKLDCNKAYNYLRWKPRYGIAEIIRKTVYWYKKFYEDPTNTYGICLEQIKEFTERSRNLNEN